MELTFETIELREICERRQAAIGLLGEPLALELGQKLSDLEAVDNAAELELLYPTAISEKGKQTWSLELIAGGRLLFRPSHLKVPLTPAGQVNWGRVTRVRIVAVTAND